MTRCCGTDASVRLGRAGAAELDEVGAAGRGARQDLEEEQPPVGRARRRPNAGAVLVERIFAQRAPRRPGSMRVPAAGSEASARRRSNGDVGAAALRRQHVVAVEDRARPAARSCRPAGGVDRRLQIAAGRDRDGGRAGACRHQQYSKDTRTVGASYGRSCLGLRLNRLMAKPGPAEISADFDDWRRGVRISTAGAEVFPRCRGNTPAKSRGREFTVE